MPRNGMRSQVEHPAYETLAAVVRRVASAEFWEFS